MKKLTVLFLLIILKVEAFGAIDPRYANASERGYDIYGDSVIFPDGSKCDLDEFNDGTCGQKWMTTDYCVEEGRHVWHKEKCCEGLEPYLAPGYDGQAKCQKIKPGADESDEEEDDSWLNNLFNNTLFWIGLLLPFIMLAVLAYSVKQKIKKRNEKDVPKN